MCELEDRWYLGSEIIVSKPKSARRAKPLLSIRMFALAGEFDKIGVTLAI